MEEKVILDITANDKKALNSIDKINSKLKKTEKQTEKNNTLFSKMGTILGGIAVVGGLASMAKHTINVASNLEEAENKLSAVFGSKGQKQINDFANAYRDSVGASVLETKNFIADAGNLFTGFGMGADEARNFSKEVLLLTNDLASFNNLSTGDAQRKMMSALMGESESAKGLGASILETQLKVASLAGGFGEYSNKMDENTKIMIRFKAIQMQSKNAVGDMERSSGSYVAQLRKMNTAIERVSILLGKALLPAITTVITAIGTFINLIAENLDIIENMAITLGILTTAFGVYYLVVNRVAIATRLMAIAQTALNVAMSLNPIGAIIVGITALVGWLTYLYNTNDEFRYAFLVSWAEMTNVVGQFANVLIMSANGYIMLYNLVNDKPIKLLAEFDTKGFGQAHSKISKIKKLVADASGATVSGVNSTTTSTGATHSSGTGTDGESYYKAFDKTGSSTTAGKSGSLSIGDITINITKKDDENDDSLIDRLTYKIANEFNRAGKIAGVL